VDGNEFVKSTSGERATTPAGSGNLEWENDSRAIKEIASPPYL